jgi:hypothetical protein
MAGIDMDRFTAGADLTDNLIAFSLRNPQSASDFCKLMPVDGQLEDNVATARRYHTSSHRFLRC